MILVIDNYDSFTYNLVQYLGELGAKLDVVRNDAMDVDALARMQPERIVISPGPGNPSQAGVSLEVIRRLGPTTPILGVCLGHQAIGQAFGATVTRARAQMHGKTSDIRHDGKGVFAGLSNPFVATRYHSLIVLAETVPDDDLEITARADDGQVMGLRHRRYPIEGVQFHPESILTVEGKRLLANFLGRPAPAAVAQ
jgi:anthranilate synthase/aminodeoxychorismate synthase-like glutamine amidotransferase